MKDHIDALEHVRCLLNGASAMALQAGAERARGIVRSLDEEIAAAPGREANILAALAASNVPGLRPRAKSIGDTLVAQKTLEDEEKSRVWLRKQGAWLAAHLDAAARAAEKAEAARDEGRKSFADLTRRVQETAKKLSTYPALADRAVALLLTDYRITRLAEISYSDIPLPPNSRSLGREWRIKIPLPADEIRRSLILPCWRGGNRVANFWPGQYNDTAFIEQPNWADLADAIIVGELARLPGSRPTEGVVDHAVAAAEARLLAEFDKVIAALDELKALDPSPGNLRQLYPDGAPVWSQDLFLGWKLAWMSKWIVLPDLRRSHHRVAAE